MFSLQKGMQTLRAAEALQLNFEECHFISEEIASLAHSLSNFWPTVHNNCSLGCHGEMTGWGAAGMHNYLTRWCRAREGMLG